jgi:NADPH:quinone reductase-like Zn-dependent oxidoreductase
VLAAGIMEIGGRVRVLELDEPRALADDEVLIEVEAAGVGNWDDVVRTGGWDVGTAVPMALGVEAAGVVLATGAAVQSFSAGDSVLTHPLPLRHQGTWAERLVAPVGTVASKPTVVPWEVAGAFAVPALTAEQVLAEALSSSQGRTLLVHGAGGVTGGLIVQLAALRGIDVIATAGASSRAHARQLGAREVVDRAEPDWTEQVRQIARDKAVAAVVNAVPGGASTAMTVVANGGRLVTITSDPPPEERDITVSNYYVRPDGRQLGALAQLLADGKLSMLVRSAMRLEDADRALASVAGGFAQGAVVIKPRSSP